MTVNLCEIRSRIPATFWPPRLLFPGENLGKVCGRIEPRFWPPGFLLLCENLGKIRGRIPARFWPPGISFPGENLAGIPARFSPGRKILAAKISPGSRRDSRRDRGGIPPRSRFLFYKGSNQFFSMQIILSKPMRLRLHAAPTPRFFATVSQFTLHKYGFCENVFLSSFYCWTFLRRNA